MGPLGYIVLVQDPDGNAAEFEAKLAAEEFTCVRLAPSDDLLAQMVEAEPSAILFSSALGKDFLERIVAEVKARFSQVPVILVCPGLAEEAAPRASLPSLDGVCYANMPPPDLAVLLRGAIRNALTVRELMDSNRKLNEISITDSLTGLYNRGYMIDRLGLEFKRAGRNRETLSCLMIDLDHFKQINDTYGHKFGDVILEAMAQRLQGLIRETDIFGRYGGEEFLIVLPNTNLEGAVKLAEKLRAGLEAEKFTHEFFSLMVTASFGVASSEDADVITADHLLQLSDRALYKAKESGRNRVCVAGQREARQEESRVSGAPGSAPAHGQRIDVVSVCPDRNPHIRALKEWEDYETVLHATQEQFLDSFKKIPPDLLVIDYSPEGAESALDAFALCKRIKRQTQDLFIPLVFLLPRPDEVLRERALGEGADDVIMYPLEGREFLIRLDSMLRLKALHDRWRGTYRDLTMARARLIKAERLSALGEMASGVAHDFNNVLSAVLGRTQILRRKVTDPEVLRSLSIIEKAANDGAATIRRIQDFSRSTTDRAYETVDMAQAIQDCIQMTRSRWKDQAESLGLRYDFQTDFSGPLRVRGNPTELREVVTNLIMNSLDAMPEGGQVRFEGRTEEEKIIFTIQDNGIGMDEEVLKRVFDPFFSTKKGEGTGLGLSVAYGIILRHNGRIECSSTKDVGTVFRIELPLEAGEPQRLSATGPETAAGSLRCLNILVVDDEAPIREIFREGLEPEGHKIFLAETGQAALEILKKEPIDLLFTDLSMPEMSGWEVAHQTKKISPDTVIVLTSGWGKDFNQKQLAQHGVSHVLPKPVPFDALQSLVRRVALGKSVPK